MQIAGRVAEGNFRDQIASNRRDELGRLVNSLAIMRNSLEARAKNDRAMMVKRSPPGL
jgi:HAMP domain-containing protein